MTEINNEIVKKRRDFADWAENAVVSLCDETNVSHRQLAILFKEYNFDWQLIEKYKNEYAEIFAVQLVEMFAVVLNLKDALKLATQQKDDYKNRSEIWYNETIDLAKTNEMLHNKLTKLTKKEKQK